VPFRSSYFLSPPFLFILLNKVFSVQDLVQAINTPMKMYECMYIGWWKKLHYDYVLAKHSSSILVRWFGSLKSPAVSLHFKEIWSLELCAIVSLFCLFLLWIFQPEHWSPPTGDPSWRQLER
jgi:hypothetical protein